MLKVIDENNVIIDGIELMAVKSIACDGCYFEEISSYCEDILCSSVDRSDKTSSIFVPKIPSFQDLIDRNYATVERRGQLSNDVSSLMIKIHSELKELQASWANHPEENGFDPIEAIDIILTTCTMLKHFGHDIPKLMEEKVKYNEQRED